MQPERTTNIKKPSQLITTPRRWKMKPGFMQHYRNFLRLPRFYETYCIAIFLAATKLNILQGNPFLFNRLNNLSDEKIWCCLELSSHQIHHHPYVY